MEKQVLLELIKEDEMKIKAEMARISALSLLVLNVRGIDDGKMKEIRDGITECQRHLDDALNYLAEAKHEVLKC